VLDFSGAANGHVPSFADAERDLVVGALRKTSGNKVAAAGLLGISRKKLYAKIAKYSLSGLSFS
jgi:DNA-binding NtrC family response regulator